jgi:glycosyltransferase involved in cell wall biosynthesis
MSLPRSARCSWPTISIVIPSYNYGRFLERAITSVLEQSYPHIQLIVIDGASTDSTPDVLDRYRPRLDVCITEPDAGQTDALNKGFRYVRGELFGWLNADDAFRLGAFSTIAHIWRQGYDLIGGVCNNIYEQDERQEFVPSRRFSYRSYFDFVEASFRGFLPQPAVFASTHFASRVFPLDADLRRAMDYQYFLRLLRLKPRQLTTRAVLVDFYYHGSNLTGSDVPLLPELVRVCEREIHCAASADRLHWQRQLQASQQLQAWLDARDPLQIAGLVHFARQQPLLLSRPLWWRLLLAALVTNLRGKR